jgi:hypothetical protein
MASDGRHVPRDGYELAKLKQREELRGKHGVAVLAPLALFDPDQHPLAVDVVDLEGGDFRHT